jgi:hypothetical protein
MTRRQFLSRTLASAAAVPFARLPGLPTRFDLRGALPDASIGWHGASAYSLATRESLGVDSVLDRRRNPSPAVDYAGVGAELRSRHRDLRRHFVFEYYPWYGTNPWRHWDQWERRPPIDLASTFLPRLGAYDSRDRTVLEQHARWIAESGAGAINISWWGPGSYEDRAVPLIMDVMHDHDVHVGFHLEPYKTGRVASYADDVLYLLREYGEKRRWDAFLLLEDASGHVGPVIKSFRTIVPREGRDCHGTTYTVSDWVPDTEWRRQTDMLREALRRQFDAITLLADVSDVERMRVAGFDGMAIYDNYVRPGTWRALAQACSNRDQVFSFNANPGFDGINLRTVEPDSCYVPSSVEPVGNYDWSDDRERDRAAHLSQARIAESFAASVGLQADQALANYRRGFFLVYINSFNEWHEGHQFEPMRDAAELTDAERALGYHNPSQGNYRLEKIRELVNLVLDSAAQG